MSSTNVNDNNNAASIDAETRLRVVDPIDRYSAFIVRGLIIGTGALGLALFMRNSRLFTVFHHVKQIPSDYLQKGLTLKGIVRDVEANGILKVEHRPSIRLPKFLGPKRPSVSTNLNLRLAGLEVSPVGAEYLHKDLNLQGRLVKFAVIKIAEGEPDIADAEITAKKAIRRINLNTELVRKGFARMRTVDDHWHRESLQFNAAYSRLITRLLTCEKVAEHRGLGLWERATWVERVQSYPSTAVQIFKHSVPTKLAVLGFELFRDFCLTVYFVAQNLYFISLELFKYCAFGYRKVAAGVDKVTLAYANAKRHLVQIGSKIGGGGQRSSEGRRIAATGQEQRK
uniref:Uncharacterized protein n=1 Tax=Globodera rostochiensis TaxID=31243 RepID=A0A914HDK1_GLORO